MARVVTAGQSTGKGQVEDELFRLLVESVRDYAIFLLDPDGRIISWNEGARRTKGYEAEEIIGKHFSIFYPPREVKHGKPDYGLRIAADEGRWEDEGWRLRKDGSRFWASVVITALYGPHGGLRGYAKVTRDLSERKRVEEERVQLIELEHAARTKAEVALERLRVIQSVTEAALAHLNLESLLADLLDRIAEILSVDTVAVLLVDEGTNELVARSARGIEEEVEQGVRVPIGRGFAGRIAAERHPVILNDVQHADVMNPILRRKGIRSLLGVPLMIEGRVLGVLHAGSLHMRQFTEQDSNLLQIVGDRVALAIDHARMVESARTAKHEAELAEATVRARDEFLSVAAHELKTPLTSLRLAGQTLLRRIDEGRTPDPASLERSLRTVDRQINRMTILVNHLLDTVRLQAGNLAIEPSLVDLVELLTPVIDQVRSQAPSHELVVRAPEDLWVQVDAMRFEQVVVNLLDNAVKFSPSGGEIDVELGRVEPNLIRFVVRDHGIGVPEAHRSQLFTRFYQAHGKEHRSGMGLGLYICRQIAEMHGGRITVEFPDDGGTRFVVELPAGAPETVRTPGLQEPAEATEAALPQESTAG